MQVLTWVTRDRHCAWTSIFSMELDGLMAFFNNSCGCRAPTFTEPWRFSNFCRKLWKRSGSRFSKIRAFRLRQVACTLLASPTWRPLPMEICRTRSTQSYEHFEVKSPARHFKMILKNRMILEATNQSISPMMLLIK